MNLYFEIKDELWLHILLCQKSPLSSSSEPPLPNPPSEGAVLTVGLSQLALATWYACESPSPKVAHFNIRNWYYRPFKRKNYASTCPRNREGKIKNVQLGVFHPRLWENWHKYCKVFIHRELYKLKYCYFPFAIHPKNIGKSVEVTYGQTFFQVQSKYCAISPQDLLWRVVNITIWPKEKKRDGRDGQCERARWKLIMSCLICRSHWDFFFYFLQVKTDYALCCELMKAWISTAGSEVANAVTSSQLLQAPCDSRVELGPVLGSFQIYYSPPFILPRFQTQSLHSICGCACCYFYRLYFLLQRVGDVASFLSAQNSPQVCFLKTVSHLPA